MGRMLFGLAALLLALPVRAQPPPTLLGPVAPSGDLRGESANFANLLLSVAQHVEGSYFRPVTQAALLEAAITGLYETAREPLPAGVRSDLATAKQHADFQVILTAARDRKSTRLNSSHIQKSRMPSSA